MIIQVGALKITNVVKMKAAEGKARLGRCDMQSGLKLCIYKNLENERRGVEGGKRGRKEYGYLSKSCTYEIHEICLYLKEFFKKRIGLKSVSLNLS